MTSSITALQTLLAERIRKNRQRIWQWHLSHARTAPPPFYSSIDLRDAGFKIAPVDSNLFPAGFNNICPEDQRHAPEIFRAQVEALPSSATRGTPKKILILPESHTSNTYYIENLVHLSNMLKQADFEILIGWWNPEGTGGESIELTSASGKKLKAHPILLGNDGVLSTSVGTPDLILMNNDFSSGYPQLLDRVAQPIVPSHRFGWHTRKKSCHFIAYNRLAKEFAEILDIDPWLISIETQAVDEVNFNDDHGIDRVQKAVADVLGKTQTAYQEHQITTAPFAFVKNNAGTYGMGIMVVHSADELATMNRRQKNKMSVGKGKLQIQSVVVQEGVPTATQVDHMVAEPVIYLSGSELIGGFLRANTERGSEDNLNSQGMVFKKLCMADLRSLEEDPDEEEPVLELVYGSIARISALAAGIEMSDTMKGKQS